MTTDSQGPRAKAKRPAIRGPFSLFHVKQKDAAGPQRRKAAQQKNRAAGPQSNKKDAAGPQSTDPGPRSVALCDELHGPGAFANRLCMFALVDYQQG